MIVKGIRFLKEAGLFATFREVKRKIRTTLQNKIIAHTPLYTKEELENQRNVVFSRSIRFSILVPLYNTPERFLKEMIHSVMDQTYLNWELCLADGSDAEHHHVESICNEYAKKDPRILYKKLEKNMGISENTNVCIDMATGEYLVLFDHDDLLHPAALFEVMKAICENNADFIYTDENTFHKLPTDAFSPHFKPDYAPDTLRSYNYICHLTVFSRELLKKAGGKLNSEFDGSQDYDLILRLTEQAERIIHIPKILYYWRSHVNSVASDISAKPYTVDAAKRALSQHLERCGLKGIVLDSKIPSTYRIAYEIDGSPLISILIPNTDHVQELKKCVNSIKEKSTYQNWEIIVIENNSIEEETFTYYDVLKKDDRIGIVEWTGEFNAFKVNTFGAQYAKGEYILFLNNHIEMITPDWLEQMLMFAQRKDVGGVGAKVYYPDNTIQHAGVAVGKNGMRYYLHRGYPRKSNGYLFRLTIAQNIFCEETACFMMNKSVWNKIAGVIETDKKAVQAADICMQIGKRGYLVVWTPYAEMYQQHDKEKNYKY